jgi:hypothetical protein
VENSELLIMHLIQAACAYSYCQCLTDGVGRQMLALTCTLFHPQKRLINGVNYQADMYKHLRPGQIKRMGKEL